MSGQSRRFSNPEYPAWIREIDLALPVNPQFLVTGNLHDGHLLPLDNPRSPEFVSTVDIIADCLLDSNFDVILRYDPVDGIELVHEAEPGSAARIFPQVRAGEPTVVAVPQLVEVLRRVVSSSVRASLILDYASRLRGDDMDAGPELRALLAAAEKLAHTAVPHPHHDSRATQLYNSVFWLVDRELDLPHWLAAIEAVRVVSVPLPSLGVRQSAAERLVVSLPGYAELDDVGRARAAATLAELTQGMSLRSMLGVTVLGIDGRIPATRLEEAVRSFRVGVLDSPWQDPRLRTRIQAGEELIAARVLGQSMAVRKSLDILIRSAIGLTGAQSGGHPGRPQGILFFAGPTGVGKTELAKSLAQVLFGSEDAYTRFDMSEFSAEQSEARLIGAPPGYIGHDAGGELTNAVRQKPFSVLLFDEVEKAHPRILDKFLQILEDGRLTDGSGSTVYFSETLIVFTSNLGIYRTVRDGDEYVRVPVVTQGEPYELIESKVRKAIEEHFTIELQRPELLNRIGDNIVIFDFISPDVGRQLVEKYVGAVVAAVHTRVEVEVIVPEGIMLIIATAALGRLAFGGRGIGSIIETAFVNPLSRELFERDLRDTTVTVQSLEHDELGWHMVVR